MGYDWSKQHANNFEDEDEDDDENDGLRDDGTP
jgi:hypothetical protein